VNERIHTWINGVHPQAGRAAISTLIHLFVTRNMPKHLQRYVAKNESMLRKHSSTWSTVAFAYADQPTRYPCMKILAWLQGWEQRDDWEPWMLTNVHELCRVVGDHASGRRAVQQAMAMPADHMHSQFRLWAAHDALVDGDSQLALRHFMGAARLENLEGHERLMHHCVESVLRMQQATDKAAAFKAVRKQLDELGLTGKFFEEQPVYRPVYQNTIQSVAKEANSLRSKWWKFSKLGLRLR